MGTFYIAEKGNFTHCQGKNCGPRVLIAPPPSSATSDSYITYDRYAYSDCFISYQSVRANQTAACKKSHRTRCGSVIGCTTYHCRSTTGIDSSLHTGPDIIHICIIHTEIFGFSRLVCDLFIQTVFVFLHSLPWKLHANIIRPYIAMYLRASQIPQQNGNSWWKTILHALSPAPTMAISACDSPREWFSHIRQENRW